MYVYFDVDERTLLRLRRAAREHKQDDTKVPIRLQLADEKASRTRRRGLREQPRRCEDGDNQMRGVFPNPSSCSCRGCSCGCG